MVSLIPRRLSRYGLNGISDHRLRNRVIEMFDEAQRSIDEEGVDLVVLCARRLACLYQVMVRHGYEPLRGAQVVSDRFLDIATPWRWDNVLILDDSVVLGTTLSNLHAEIAIRVEEVNGGTVRTSAVCVDQDKSASYLLERVQFHGALPVPTKDVEQFSTDVVTTLFTNGVPFFSDFPVSREIKLHAKDALAHLSGHGWHVADVTAPLFSSEQNAAYVQIPDPSTTTLDDLLSRMPPTLSTLVDAFKLRTYIGRDSYMADDVSASFVPLALLRACREEELDHALLAAAQTMDPNVSESAQLQGIDGAAKHRLVQFYASVFMLHAMATPEMRRAFGNSQWLDDVSLDLYFGVHAESVRRALPPLRRFVEESESTNDRVESLGYLKAPPSPLLEDDDLRSLLWEQRELLAAAGTFAPAPDGGAPDQGEMTKVGLMVGHAVNSIFGYISENFEQPQQREIRLLENYSQYAERFLAHPGSRILNRTLTMDELTTAIWDQSSAHNAWSRAMVSLGIDMGNDLGIVVPVTQVDPPSGLIYRGYRLGETAQLAQHPLARWSGSADGAFDAFIQAAANYPTTTTNVTLALPSRFRRRHNKEANPDGLRHLREWLERNKPGVAVGRFDGVISEVDEEGRIFYADITNVSNLDIAQARLGTDMVPDTQMELLTPGGVFHWTVFERSEGGPKYRTSRLRMAPRSRLRTEDIDLTMRTFSFLVDAE